MPGPSTICVFSVCGFMSSMLMMRPSSAMNAIESATNVFFIQKPSGSVRSNTNSMPWSGFRLNRFMRPTDR